jgi:gluconate kinase
VNLLDSQLKTLEVPKDAIIVDASQSVEMTVTSILAALHAKGLALPGP